MSGWSVRIGETMPDFPCQTTKGDFTFHEYLEKDGNWTMLFSHPKDYTPVCTTELGMAHQLSKDFANLGVKMIGVSCDSIEDHNGWTKDVLFRCKCTDDNELNFPIIADADRSIVTNLGMLDPAEKDAAGVPLPARALHIIGADKKIKLSILYPATTGRNFEEIARVVRSLKLTAEKKLATPVNWKEGERLIVAPSCSTEDAEKQFEGFKIEELPSGKPYLRSVDCPKD